MSRRMIVFAVLQLIAVWPVIHWYVLRLLDSSDSPVPVIALITVFVCLIRDRKLETNRGHRVWLSALMMMVYAATFPLLPPLLRAVTAFAAVGTFWCVRENSPRGRTGLLGLIFLALPLQASMHFYLGYPLRVVSGYVSVLMLRSNGVPVTLDGTLFQWGETLIQIDAPCSGANMLWMSLYMALALSAVYRLGWKMTLFLSGIYVVETILANACRMTALFYMETNSFQGPEWLHSMVGIMVFLLSALVLAWIFQILVRPFSGQPLNMLSKRDGHIPAI